MGDGEGTYSMRESLYLDMSWAQASQAGREEISTGFFIRLRGFLPLRFFLSALFGFIVLKCLKKYLLNSAPYQS